MADRTAINYVDASWSPVAGCTPVSAGCANCFAARHAGRRLRPFHDGEPFSTVRCREDQVDVPLRWRKPRTILVPTLGDLFHPDVSDAFRDLVFAAMALCPQHRFLMPTKRPERVKTYISEASAFRVADAIGFGRVGSGLPYETRADTANRILRAYLDHCRLWPLPNLWLGVSVEDQAAVDARIPILLDTPAAHRWVSVEPMLGPVNLREMAHRDDWFVDALDTPDPTRSLDWVVIGGETGPRARVCRLEWIRDVVGQCRAAGVPVWVKQLGHRYEPGGTYLSDELLAVRERPVEAPNA